MIRLARQNDFSVQRCIEKQFWSCYWVNQSKSILTTVIRTRWQSQNRTCANTEAVIYLEKFNSVPFEDSGKPATTHAQAGEPFPKRISSLRWRSGKTPNLSSLFHLSYQRPPTRHVGHSKQRLLSHRLIRLRQLRAAHSTVYQLEVHAILSHGQFPHGSAAASD